MGVSLEFLQGMGGHRHFEYADMIANAVGVFLGLLLTTTVFKGALHWFELRLLSGRIKT
jgi:glycopeptide antibiotics resistance protein